MGNNNTLLYLNIIISIILICIILYFVGVNDVLKVLEHIDWLLLFVSMAFLLLMDVVMVCRFTYVLAYLGERIGFIDAMKAHFVGMLTADFTPARAGYFATVGVLSHKYGVKSEHALLSILSPQIFDFALKVSAGAIAALYIFYVFTNFQGWFLLVGVAGMLIMLAVMMLVLFSPWFLCLFRFVEHIPAVSKIYLAVVKMQENSHRIVTKTPQLICFTLLAWAFKAISWYFVAKAIGITVDLGFPEVFFYFFLQPLLTLLEFMPSPTLAGLGLSEGGAALVFSLFGVPAASGATFALLARFKTTFVHLPAVFEALETIRKGN